MKILAYILFLFGLFKIVAMWNISEKSLSITEVNNIFDERQLLEITKIIISIDGALEILFSVYIIYKLI